MSLESRQKNFDILAKQFDCQRPDNLILVHKIKPELYDNLRYAAAVYLSRCLGPNEIITDEQKLLSAIMRNRESIKNITPNGMVVPKRHLNLEYNMLVRAYVNVIESLNIREMISSWHIPLNLRLKDPEMRKENMGRHHPTEDIHSDSWAGESAESVTTIIPLFGDIERNYVKYFSPPQEFEESWLGARPSYKDGADIAAKYKPIDMKQSHGYVYLADFATLHSSSREANAGPRISIDTTFALKRLSEAKGKDEVIHDWRKNERMSPDMLATIGEKCMFYFPQTLDQQVDSKGGFKHPTELEVVNFP